MTTEQSLKFMTTEQNIEGNKEDHKNGWIKRERRHYKPFESKKPRPRNSCPKCGSINVRKRIHTRDYKCHHCGWNGENIAKTEY